MLTCHRYLLAAGAEGVKHMLPYVVEVAPALLRTRPGMNAVLECVALGDAKTRKQIARTMKDDIVELMQHPFAHMVAIRLLDVTDDTVMIKNTILKPCVTAETDLEQLLAHRYGNKFIMHLLTPRSPRIFTSQDLEFLQPQSTLTQKAVFEPVDSETKPKPLGRKDPAKRRAELLAFVKDHVSKSVKANVTSLVADPHGCHIVEAILSSQWLSLDSEFMVSIAEAAVTAPEEESDDDEEEETEEVSQREPTPPIAEDTLHASFRRMLKGADGAKLAPALFKAMKAKDSFTAWATRSNSAFVSFISSRWPTLISPCPHVMDCFCRSSFRCWKQTLVSQRHSRKSSEEQNSLKEKRVVSRR